MFAHRMSRYELNEASGHISVPTPVFALLFSVPFLPKICRDNTPFRHIHQVNALFRALLFYNGDSSNIL